MMYMRFTKERDGLHISSSTGRIRAHVTGQGITLDAQVYKV